ncbi:MAG: type VI secretion system tube protein Hcp [Candidatus Thiodiazotropha sp.]
MAVEIIMKAGDILGESETHEKSQWIAISSFTHGVVQDITTENMKIKRERAGTPHFSFMTIRKKVDVATPDLLIHCIKGTLIPKIEIKVFQASRSDKPLMLYTLENCFIASATAEGADDTSEPMESVAFAYNTIKLECNPLKSGGSMTKNFDLSTGSAVA